MPNRHELDWDAVSKAALECKRKSEFVENYPSEYQEACRRGWVENVCEHMENDVDGWTLESLISQAALYDSRSQFAAHSTGAYITARDRGILDEVCAQMDAK